MKNYSKSIASAVLASLLVGSMPAHASLDPAWDYAKEEIRKQDAQWERERQERIAEARAERVRRANEDRDRYARQEYQRRSQNPRGPF